MKRIFLSFLALAASLLLCSTSFAAGAVVTRLADRGDTSPHGMVWEFTADSVTAAFPVLTVADVTGYISALEIELDGTAPADSVTLALTSATGVPILTSAALTANSRVVDTGGAQMPVANGFKVTPTTNTVVSGKFKLIVYGFFDETY